jgi:hypothetical protein
VVGQVLHAMLQRGGDDAIGQAVVVEDRVGTEGDASGGGDGAGAEVSVGVVIVDELDGRRAGRDGGAQRFEPLDGRGPRRVDVRHQHDWRGCNEIEGCGEAGADEHERGPILRQEGERE